MRAHRIRPQWQGVASAHTALPPTLDEGPLPRSFRPPHPGHLDLIERPIASSMPGGGGVANPGPSKPASRLSNGLKQIAGPRLPSRCAWKSAASMPHRSTTPGSPAPPCILAWSERP